MTDSGVDEQNETKNGNRSSVAKLETDNELAAG
jgi:hypothetical protein